MSDTFKGIEDRGLGLVAVFTNLNGEEYALNKDCLETRIKNVEDGKAHPDRDASVERWALDVMNKQNKEVTLAESQ